MSSKTLKPIENILDSISMSINPKKSVSSMTSTAPAPSKSLAIPSLAMDDIIYSNGFKIIMSLMLILFGIIAYTYLEKEINELIQNIKEYLEVKKYTKEENKIRKEQEIEKENTDKEDTTQKAIEDTQKAIKKEKKNPTPSGVYPATNDKIVGSKIETEVEDESKDTLQKALNDASQTVSNVEPSNASSGKKGWCLIGADKGFRSCVEIGVNDTCMSGDIYPRKDVCINPSLRA